MPRLLLRSLLALLVLACAATADAAELPRGGTSLLPDDALQAMQVSDASKVEQRQIDIAGQSFQKAMEVHLPGPVMKPWDVQYTCNTQRPVKKGDVLHARLNARCIKSMSGTAALGVVFEMSQEPWDKSLDFQHSVGSEWKVIDIPFVARRDFAAGEAHLCIRVGYANQTMQIGGIQLLNYGQGFDRSLLPLTQITYGGREASAPWRKAAAERIETIRKANLKVTVKDPAGKPIPAAQVHIALLRHEFAWGTGLDARPMLGSSPDDMKYREMLKTYFNHVVIGDALKWDYMESNGSKHADPMVAWALENHFTVRGHNLIWPGKEYLPKRVAAMIDKPEQLRKLCDTRITDTAARYTGKLVDWDVINEPSGNHYVQDVLGQQEMVRWFKLAKAADPKAKLYINDYEILASSNSVDSTHQKQYADIIKYLLDQGAPVEGIGMQGHFSTNLTDPENLLRILDRFAQFKLPIKVTELDITLADEKLRADYMRDLCTILFSHPAVVGVLQWGFWEKYHWIPEAAIFDTNWNLRPHGKAWVDLVHKQWKTDLTQPTNAAGQVAVRGFKGDYEITVTTSDGQTARQAVLLTAANAEVTITVK